MRVLARSVVAALAAVLLLGALGSAASAAQGPYPPPSGASASASPSRVAAGECTTFSGTGFAPGTVVTIADDGTVLGTTTADASGAFSYEVCFRTDAKRGRHVLTATGTGADGQPLVLSATVVVTGVEQSGVSPASDRGSGTAVLDGRLALTGGPTLLLVLAGTALLTLGAVLLLVAEARGRRRRRSAVA